VRSSGKLHRGAADLAERTIVLAQRLLDTEPAEKIRRGGRKAHALD
jgi:hypothetical protein